MDREIKFKRAHFFDEERNQFSHYSEWGVGIKGSTFTSPSSNNFAPYFRDYQFTGLHYKNGMEIYEGDVLSCVYWGGENCVVKYEQDDRWIGYWFPKDDKDLIEVIGNIHTGTNSK